MDEKQEVEFEVIPSLITIKSVQIIQTQIVTNKFN